MDLVTFDSDHDQKPSKTNGRGRKIRHQNRVQPMQERLKRAQGSSKNYVSCSLNPFDHLKCWKKCISGIHQQFIPGATFQLWPRLTLFPEAFPICRSYPMGNPTETPTFFGSGFGVGEKSPQKIIPPVGEIPKIQKVSFLDGKNSSKIWVKFMIYMVQYLQIGISWNWMMGKF